VLGPDGVDVKYFAGEHIHQIRDVRQKIPNDPSRQRHSEVRRILVDIRAVSARNIERQTDLHFDNVAEFARPDSSSIR